MDKHVPIIDKKIRDSHHQPWFNDKIKNEIILRRKKERIWLKEQSEYTLNAFYTQWRHVANIIKTAQCQYYKEIIQENHNDYKAIYNIANSLLFRKSESPIPDIKPLSLLVEEFNEFFHAKIVKIMERLKLNQKTHNPNKLTEDGYQTELRIGTLTSVSYMDVINMVKSVQPKSCDLDSIPTKILKNHIDALAHGIANIINTSFEHGYVCDSLKEAIIRPLLKLPALNLVFPNFRPISNLAYLGKLAESLSANNS